jgi:hypothetical protein
MLATLALFTTGVAWRPPGAGTGLVYDLVLYNAVYILGAMACWPSPRAGATQRSTGRWLAVALGLNAVANVLYTLVYARMADPPYPSLADVLYLAYYPPVYVVVVRLARARVARFHASMWLDGLIGSSGAAAVAIAVLLAPAWNPTGSSTAEVATNLAYPVADVLLLALMVGVGGVLGMRSDRALLLLGAGLLCNLVGDIVYLDLAALGTYTEGGVLDLSWLLGVAFLVLAVQAPSPAAPGPGRSGTAEGSPDAATRRAGLVEWRVLAVPLVCGLAGPAAALRRLLRGRLPARGGGAHGGHLPRDLPAAGGRPRGPHRRADRAAQPAGADGAGAARAGRCHPRAAGGAGAA